MRECRPSGGAAANRKNRMNTEELKAFFDAIPDEGTVTGLYDFHTTS